MSDRTRTLPQMEIRAEINPATINEEDRTVEVVFTTGQAGERGGYWSDPYIEQLRVDSKSIRTERLDKGLSVIDSHKTYRGIDGVFGITEEYRIENDELVGKIRFSKRPEADLVFQDVKDRILKHFSLGYRVFEYERKSAPDGELDTYTAVDWMPTELSIVPVSFETNNGVRTASDEEFNVKITNLESEEMGDTTNTPVVDGGEQRGADAGTNPVVTTPVTTPDTNPEDQSRNIEAGLEAQRQMLPTMMDACRKAGIETTFATDEFAKGTSVDNFRSMVLDKLEEKSKSRGIQTGGSVDLNSDQRQDQAEQTRENITTAILSRANPELFQGSEQSREWEGMRLMDIGRELLVMRGESVRGMSPMTQAERMLSSTSGFSQILADVANKSMKTAYQEIPRTFQSIGTRATASDFKDIRRLQLGDAPSLEELNENGEFTRGKMTESGESYGISTYGKIFGLTRKVLINDDLDAFARLPALFGSAASRKQSDLVWGLLLGYDFKKNAAKDTIMADGKSLFHKDHGNLLAAAGGKLSVEAISKMRQLGRKQKTQDGNFMNVEYRTIAVPTGQETLAEQLLLAQINPTSDDQTNPFKSRYGIIVEPRLDVVSEDAFYMFSDKRIMPTFDYTFLAGEDELNIETRSGFEVDGFEIRARMDFGAGVTEYRGMAKSDGKA
ncbi:hypothetical protein A134_23100 [Vibrio crassostreae 9CS106]|uniref:Bacteriophage Mu GpT domain-containing protein n=1 Tax=Vibrio crassostreae 9CS106 TaxID=1191300 RepID=A0A1B1C378_9VIBR|nr:hypothetical protein A134_23100 [Vibrio crassostreae 9CS106]